MDIAQKIRTKQDGNYKDQVLELVSSWQKGETPTIKEIVILKLYTDWDELQFELKKCFRLDRVNEIVEEYTELKAMELFRNSRERVHSDPTPVYSRRITAPYVHVQLSQTK